MTGDGDDLATEAWRAMRQLVLDHDRRQAVADATGISFGRVKLLRHLAAGPSGLRALAAHLGADPPYVTVMANDLEARGLVERVPHPTDGRAKHVRLTEAGRRVAAHADRLLDDPPPALREADPDDLRRLIGLLAAKV
jgi:DNA-binding MarR family transcriptional regulator